MIGWSGARREGLCGGGALIRCARRVGRHQHCLPMNRSLETQRSPETGRRSPMVWWTVTRMLNVRYDIVLYRTVKTCWLENREDMEYMIARYKTSESIGNVVRRPLRTSGVLNQQAQRHPAMGTKIILLKKVRYFFAR